MSALEARDSSAGERDSASFSSAIEALRESIRRLEGGRIHWAPRTCGVAVFDTLIGGLPSPGLVEIHGRPGSGRTRLVMTLVARLTGLGTSVALVDPACVLYPPAIVDLGVDLDRLLIVHPPGKGRMSLADRGVPLDWESWAIEQLLRSGCFPVVVAIEPRVRGRAGYRWERACQAGGCTGIVIRRHASRGLPAQVRLALDGGGVVVVRDRTGHGPPGRRHTAPASPVKWGLAS